MAEQRGGAADGSDPIAALAEGAQTVRALFNAYLLVGFSEAQALHLVTAIITTHIRASQAPGGGITE